MTLRYRSVLVVFVVAVVALAASGSGAPAGASAARGSLAGAWKAVQAARDEGQPQTAKAAVDRVLEAARRDRAWPWVLKALSVRWALDAEIDGKGPETRIVAAEAELARCDEALRPMLRVLLAEWYWQYYQGNRWRFRDRSATAGADDGDFTTWDLPRLFARVDALYQEALKDRVRLRAERMGDWRDFFEAGSAPEDLRPTLYDVVVHRALEFYGSGDQPTPKSRDAYEMDADSGVLDPVERFVALTPDTADASSPLLRALALWQELLAWHRSTGAEAALVDADLLRLRFCRDKAFGATKKDHYLRRLEELTRAHGGVPVVTKAWHEWARELQSRGELVRAVEVARKGAALHQGSLGARNCAALVAEVLARSASLSAERTTVPGPGRLALTYRNVGELHFRVVADRWDAFLRGRWAYDPDQLDRDQLRALLSRKPAAAWTVKLEPTADYKDRTRPVDLPALTPGFYRVVSSWRSDFALPDGDEPANDVQAASLWVSSLRLVPRARNGRLEGLVLDARTGEPLEGVEVVGYDQGSGKWARQATARTDKQGLFAFDGEAPRRGLLLVAARGDDRSVADSAMSSYPRSRAEAADRAAFFTDRAIYRPGQEIRFKGLLHRVDAEADEYKTLPDRDVVVGFYDVNGRKVGEQRLRSNAHGSVSGQFTAPTGTLTGQMRLQAEGYQGAVSFRVEEYKRPRFLAALEPPAEGGALGATVAVKGTATSYTGAPVDGAKVRWRVSRSVQYPWWRSYWWCPPAPAAQELAHGLARTDAGGGFALSFEARPDPTVERADEPTFSFEVTADVTDPTGETRSATTTVRLGYAAMEARVAAAEWLTAGEPVRLDVSTATLDGRPVAAKGTLEVYALEQPAAPAPKELGMGWSYWGAPERREDPSTWTSWADGARVAAADFATDATGAVAVPLKLAAGAYRVRLASADRAGKPVKAFLPLMVLDPGAGTCPVRVPSVLRVKSARVEVGGTLELLWGTGYDAGRALVEVEHRGALVQRFWTEPGRTQRLVTVPVAEAFRGGFTVHVTHVRDNRLYTYATGVEVPWTTKDLDVRVETFHSTMTPGAPETWTLRVKGKDAAFKAAEAAATLYDASLDVFAPHGWSGLQGVFRRDWSDAHVQDVNRRQSFGSFVSSWNRYQGVGSEDYWRFPPEVGEVSFGGMNKMMLAMPCAAMPPGGGGPPMRSRSAGVAEASMDMLAAGGAPPPPPGEPPAQPAGTPAPALDAVVARKDLGETSFFYPHLAVGEDGAVTVTFTAPEALTTWKLLGLAHGPGLQSGVVQATAVTRKDLMVQPTAPRFLREGDELWFSAKVVNMAATPQKGSVRLTWRDAVTDKVVDQALGLTTTDQAFEVPAGQSRAFFWKLQVPGGLPPLAYKIVAASEKFSDGEEGVLPVLSGRVLVTESLPLPIRGPATKRFQFKKLVDSAASKTLAHQALTVQVTSNPAWYAVQALPYLMEYPHECSEQVFNRLYANALARHVATSDPKVRRVFDQWRGTAALASNLEKNEQLKSVLLAETPWVREAAKESEAKRNVGVLFERNRLDHELASALKKLGDMRRSDGAWSWFPGGPANDFITLYVLTGFGRLRHLEVQVATPDLKPTALYLDGWLRREYEEILRAGHPEDDHLSSTVALYLYGRTFFKDPAVAEGSRKAFDYFVGQARKNWLKLDRMSQGHLALALARLDDRATADKIVRSLREHAMTSEELGMYWADEASWWWWRAPVETQAVMIEVFQEVARDRKAVDDAQVWLLKQKQTQHWPTTKATADAVYALLLRGRNLLASSELVEVSLGGQPVRPEKVEAGTGFYEQRWAGVDVRAAMGDVQLVKKDEGVAWGSLHWQYFEDLDKVTPHQTPLALTKTLFVERATDRGPVIEPLKEQVLHPGDLLKVRVVLKADRAMEFVHLKDQRGSGTEPVNVLSQYKNQDGLWYYEATGDTATNFFIDYVREGTYVFEYPLRVVHKGRYQSGMATIQCMYAPEFNSHSGSVRLSVEGE